MHASPGNVWHAPMETADEAELEMTYGLLNAKSLSIATFTVHLSAKSQQ
jgi:hypothetical protein